ncbi:unnamed protein product [Ixodes pacificus]
MAPTGNQKSGFCRDTNNTFLYCTRKVSPLHILIQFDLYSLC